MNQRLRTSRLHRTGRRPHHQVHRRRAAPEGRELGAASNALEPSPAVVQAEAEDTLSAELGAAPPFPTPPHGETEEYRGTAPERERPRKWRDL